YSFLNPAETITSEKYAQQVDEIKGPIHLHDNAQLHNAQPMLQKLNELGSESPNLLPTNYHFFKHLNNFLQGKCFHNQQDAGNAFQHTDFYVTGINKLISCWQKCVDCNGFYFD
ncbi:hypothetical protein H8957_017504, partial [Semnopithecus entellus]